MCCGKIDGELIPFFPSQFTLCSVAQEEATIRKGKASVSSIGRGGAELAWLRGLGKEELPFSHSGRLGS